MAKVSYKRTFARYLTQLDAPGATLSPVVAVPFLGEGDNTRQHSFFHLVSGRYIWISKDSTYRVYDALRILQNPTKAAEFASVALPTRTAQLASIKTYTADQCNVALLPSHNTSIIIRNPNGSELIREISLPQGTHIHYMLHCPGFVGAKVTNDTNNSTVSIWRLRDGAHLSLAESLSSVEFADLRPGAQGERMLVFGCSNSFSWGWIIEATPDGIEVSSKFKFPWTGHVGVSRSYPGHLLLPRSGPSEIWVDTRAQVMLNLDSSSSSVRTRQHDLVHLYGPFLLQASELNTSLVKVDYKTSQIVQAYHINTKGASSYRYSMPLGLFISVREKNMLTFFKLGT